MGLAPTDIRPALRSMYNARSYYHKPSFAWPRTSAAEGGVSGLYVGFDVVDVVYVVDAGVFCEPPDRVTQRHIAGASEEALRHIRAVHPKPRTVSPKGVAIGAFVDRAIPRRSAAEDRPSYRDPEISAIHPNFIDAAGEDFMDLIEAGALPGVSVELGADRLDDHFSQFRFHGAAVTLGELDKALVNIGVEVANFDFRHGGILSSIGGILQGADFFLVRTGVPKELINSQGAVL